MAQAARRGEQGQDTERRRQQRQLDGDAEEAPAGPGLFARDVHLGSACVLGGRLGEPARPEERSAEDRQGCRDQRHRNQGRDDHRDRHARAEGAEKADAGEQQGHRRAGDHQRRGQDHRQQLRGRLAHGRGRSGPLAKPLTVAGDEEDEVVGEHAEDQGDDHRLRLAWYREPIALGYPAEHSIGAEVGDRHRRHAKQRHPERAEVEREDRDDEEGGRQLDPDQVAFGDLGFGSGARQRPGHLHHRDRGGALEPGRKALGAFLGFVFAQVRVEVEIGDERGRGPIGPEHPGRVGKRHRLDRTRLFAAVRRGDVAGGGGGLGSGEAAGVAGDDHCPAQQRKPEGIERPAFDLEGLGRARQEVAQLTGFGFECRRQVGDRHDGRGDPGG